MSPREMVIMRYGDEDGINVIYDAAGDPILHANESVLVSEESIIPTLKTTWRLYGGENLNNPSKGSLYLTNERMIFINSPERMMAISGDRTRVMNSDKGGSFSLGDLGSDATVREYFEITNIEIMATEKKEGAVSVGEMVNIYILSSGNQFHISVVLDSGSNLLKRLMNKRVSSSDELVKNLKEFFKNTDWMYLPMEKDIYGGEVEPQETTRPEPGPAESPKVAPRITPKVTGRVQKRTTTRLHSKIESQSMKYFNNLYEKGLITEEIYNRLIQQYNGGSNGPSSPFSGPRKEEVVDTSPVKAETPVRPEPKEHGPLAEPEAEARPKAYEEPPIEPMAEELPEAIPTSPDEDDEPASPSFEAREPEPDESDEDLLGMLSDTLADMVDEPDEEQTPDDNQPGSDVPDGKDDEEAPPPPSENGSDEDKGGDSDEEPRKIARKVKQMVVRQG